MLIYFQPQLFCCNFVSGGLPPGTALSWEEQEAMGQGSEQPPPPNKILNLALNLLGIAGFSSLSS